MKNFKSFINEAGPNAKPKAKGEADFVDAHKVEISDPEEQGTDGSAKVTTKEGSGKRKADRLDNKQAMGEEVEELDELSKSTLASYAKKATRDARMKMAAGKDFERHAITSRKPEYKAGAKEWENKYKSDARRREAGANKAIDRLAKEEVEKLDELSNKKLDRYVDKAHDSIQKLSQKRDDLQWQHDNVKDIDKEKHKKRIADIDRKLKNRERGMDSADHDRLAKEEVELDEAKLDVDKEIANHKKTGETHMDKFRRRPGGAKEPHYTAQSNSDFRLANHHASAAHHLQSYKETGDKKHLDRYKSTKKNINAEKKTNEEVELDEQQLIEMDKSGAPFTPDKPKKNPPAKAGKYGQGPSTAKHLAQMALKKQLEKMKEEVEESIKPELEKHFPASGVRKHAPYTNPGLEKLAQQKKTLRTMKKSMKEADFSKQQTKMAHTIGKEFEKKGVGDQYKGGPYAVASAMVRDKPESAKKAYKTIQSKMKEEADTELLFKLYNDLNEENQEFFMHQLEEDAEALLDFAKMLEE